MIQKLKKIVSNLDIHSVEVIKKSLLSMTTEIFFIVDVKSINEIKIHNAF